MNYQKLDSQLAAECEGNAGESKNLSVFVRTRTPLPAEALHEIQRLQGSKPDPANSILTMDLSAKEVADLSEEPWVINIRLSRKLRSST